MLLKRDRNWNENSKRAEQIWYIMHTWLGQPATIRTGENREHFVSSGVPSPDSSVGIANRYRLDGPGIESRWGEIYRTRPNWPWGSPSLLYNGYRVFPGARLWPPTPMYGRGWRKSRAIHLLPLWAFVARSRVNFTFTLLCKTDISLNGVIDYRHVAPSDRQTVLQCCRCHQATFATAMTITVCHKNARCKTNNNAVQCYILFVCLLWR